jgi:tetratricopeptide (TPR) repeat protein
MARMARAAVSLALLVGSGCQTSMSLEEARRVSTSFSGAAFVPPPRTISDITAILDQEKREDPQVVAEVRARADEAPPATTEPARLATFYLERSRAARDIGRARQEIDDLGAAVRHAVASGGLTRELNIRIDFCLAVLAGNLARGNQCLSEGISRASANRRSWLITFHSISVFWNAAWGDIRTAEAAYADLLTVYNESLRFWHETSFVGNAFERIEHEARLRGAEGQLARASGKLADAERLFRRTIELLESAPALAGSGWLDDRIVSLSSVLRIQGRLLEAEHEARRALLRALRKGGRYTFHTAKTLAALVAIVVEQGRYVEAERLARADLEIFEKIGLSPAAVFPAAIRQYLAAALGFQGRWREALDEYEVIRAGFGEDAEGYQQFMASAFGRTGQIGRATALLVTGQAEEALRDLSNVLKRTPQLADERHRDAAEIRGLMAMAHAATGDRGRALREFAEVIPLLITTSSDAMGGPTCGRPGSSARG